MLCFLGLPILAGSQECVGLRHFLISSTILPVKNQIRYDAYKTDEEGEDIVGGIELIMLRGPSAASTKKRNSGLLGSGLSGIAKITKTVWNVVRLPEHIVLYASASKQRYSCYPRSTLNSTQFRTSAVL
jgi:hypothetical protein